jgi:hypothetical protein
MIAMVDCGDGCHPAFALLSHHMHGAGWTFAINAAGHLSFT